jgi:hypothetical protein
VTDLGTLRGFAERRGVDEDPTDLKAIRALADASAFIRGYTHQQITLVEDESFALDGTGRAGLILPQVPVVEICEVSTLDAENTPTEVTSYRCDRAGILWRMDGYAWPIGHANVVVSYDHGYDVVPADIAGVCYDLAAENYVATGAGEVTGETIGNYQVTYAAESVGTSGLNEYCLRVLESYRVPQ